VSHGLNALVAVLITAGVVEVRDVVSPESSHSRVLKMLELFTHTSTVNVTPVGAVDTAATAVSKYPLKGN
jgi:hypothetical protein